MRGRQKFPRSLFGEIVTLRNEQEAIGQMFDHIASTYDSVNRILSFRQDVRWRKIVARTVPTEANIAVLDVATGTADLLITIGEMCPQVTRAVGVDIAENMLSCGEKKICELGLSSRMHVEKGDARKLPFGDQQFDVVTIAFGIRNVVGIEGALQEMKRVLKPGGRLIILEFSLPKNWFFRMVYLCYFRYALPFIGGMLARNIGAYRYLNRTVEEFFSVEAFSELLSTSGFNSITATSLSFGIATMYSARKS